jgi:hypothetical protein
LIDPWLKQNPQTPAIFKDLSRYHPSAILVSHSHFDHSQDAMEIAQASGAPVVSSGDWVEKGCPRSNSLAANLGRICLHRIRGNLSEQGQPASRCLAQRARGNPANVELRSFSPVFLGLLGMVATQFHARGTLIGNLKLQSSLARVKCLTQGESNNILRTSQRSQSPYGFSFQGPSARTVSFASRATTTSKARLAPRMYDKRLKCQSCSAIPARAGWGCWPSGEAS